MLVQQPIVSIEQPHQRSRCFCGLTVKDVLQFLSSLILPLMLGVFTVVITFQQQKLAQEQRMEDMNVARQQRLEDRNESQLQREQDKNQSQSQRKQDWDIAQMAQLTQTKIIQDQYQDEVLIAYIKEMGDLLEKKNGSLTSDPLTHTLARIKTLNAIRQLDETRQIHIVRFLYEAGQLTTTKESIALDISTAELIGIDFRKFGRLVSDEELSFAGVYLINSTFSDIVSKNVNFSSARFNNVNFSSARFDKAKFSSVEFDNVNFLPTNFMDVNFSSARFVNVNFSSPLLYYANFSSALLYKVNFSSARFGTVIFSSAELVDVNFSSAHFSRLYGLTRFDHARMAHSIFDEGIFEETIFSYANLKNASFRNANLSTVNFSLANLQNADFTNSTITDRQLESALSIRNAKLPNGTLGQGRNLIKNGHANCNTSLFDHWQVKNGSIMITPTKENPSQCHFSLQSKAIGAIMSQQVALVDIWDSSFWKYSNVELKAQMSNGVSLELIGKTTDGTIVNKQTLSSTDDRIIINWTPISIFFERTTNLEVVLKFNAQQNVNDNEDSWCGNIELFLNYDTEPWYPVN